MMDSRFADLTALVVDDSRTMRALMRSILEDAGVGRVLEAASGGAALRAMDDADGLVDIVFCDLEMPGIDGVDTVRGIAARQPDCGLVVASGLDHKLCKTVANLGTDLGLNVLGSLGKPVDPERIVAMLEALLRKPRSQRRKGVLTISEEEVENALADGRVDVYYQPKISLASGRITGVEALARLHHPTLGTLLPDTFIPVAESCGLIIPLSLHVAETAFAECARWARAGLALSVAINLSASSLRKTDMPELIASLAAGKGLPPDRVVLELTETELGESAEIMHAVTRFRIRRFRLSIDDFGTGHSGLQRLSRLPFTELKIDRSFVQGLAADAEQCAIVDSMIKLGRQLNMDTVAEGVEEAEDWERLGELGCDYAQGFAAARPMAGAGLADWAQAWKVSGPAH